MTLTIGMTYDLRTDYLAEGYSEAEVAEFDSPDTIEAIEAAIVANGYRVDRIGNVRALCRRLVDGDRWDLVFNIAEGLSGRSREAQAPAVLEAYGVAYTFSDPLVCAATLDKGTAKRLVQHAGIATAPFTVVDTIDAVDAIDLDVPLFVKPLAEGTGKGVDPHSFVRTREQLADACRTILADYRQPALVEAFLPGVEMTVGVLGCGRDATVLGTMRIETLADTETGIYSYQAKEQCERIVRYSPMPTGPLRETVEALALRAYRVLECRDAARVDFRCDGAGQPAFLEINPLPGLHPTHSDLPMIATQEGMTYNDLIGGIIRSAERRTRDPRDTHERSYSAGL